MQEAYQIILIQAFFNIVSATYFTTIAYKLCSVCSMSLCVLTRKASLAYCNNGNDREKVKALVALFYDALFHIPASSIAVEKLHACAQQNCHARKAGRIPVRIQENSYLMAVVLEHTRLKAAIESETLGANKVRAARLLHARLVSRTTPGKLSTRANQEPAPSRKTVLFLDIYQKSG